MEKNKNIGNTQQGFAALFITILVLAVVFSIIVSVSVLTFGEQKILKNTLKSTQSYYLAEAGLEDAILRLKKSLSFPGSYVLQVGPSITTVAISDVVGGTRTITSTADVTDRVRKVAVTYEISADNVSFFYGAQVGQGGVEMDDNTIIDGNVFSNGSIIAEGSNSQIIGTAKIASIGNRIQRSNVSVDAYADICSNTYVGGVLYANATTGCTAAGYGQLSEISPIDLPIPQAKIDEWKAEAAAGGASGSYTLSSGTATLGPRKIQGNLTIQNNAQLFITGTVWVTGAVIIKNNAQVRLDSAGYGVLSGVIVADGVITLENNSISRGTGQTGSYLMYLSTSSLKPALVVKNNAQADIIYTSHGWIGVENNTGLRQVTGYGIELKNNARITYEIGLEDAAFSSGPGGAWQVTNWKEVE